MAICGFIVLYFIKYFYYNIANKYIYQTELGKYVYQNPDQEWFVGTVGILIMFSCIVFHIIMFIAYLIELLLKKHRKIKRQNLYTNPILNILFYIGITVSYLPDFTVFYALTIPTLSSTYITLIIFYLIIFLIYEITERILNN